MNRSSYLLTNRSLKPVTNWAFPMMNHVLYVVTNHTLLRTNCSSYLLPNRGHTSMTNCSSDLKKNRAHLRTKSPTGSPSRGGEVAVL